MNSAAINASGQADTPSASVDIARDQILAKNLFTSLIISAVNSTFIVVLLATQSDAAGVRLWYLTLIVATALRAIYAKYLISKSRGLSPAEIWIITALTAAAGLMWGALPLFFGGQASPIIEHLMIFMIAGMSAGACLAFSTHLKVVIAFNLPALMMLIAHYAHLGGVIEYAMCGALILYFIVTIGLARNSRNTIESALQNQFIAERQRLEILDKKCSLDAQIFARVKTEAKLTVALDQKRIFDAALENICKAYIVDNRSTQNLIREITEQISKALGVERVSVWFIASDNNEFECRDLFEASKSAHSANAHLIMAAYPAYFKAVSSNRIIDAGDAKNDPRTAPLFNHYLAPADIRSKLDAPVFSANSLSGMISCETIGKTRYWTIDEIAFVKSAAQFVSMSLLADDSRELAEALQEALFEAQDASTAKSSFLATMSHEIRTPMNGVLGAGSLLEKMDLDDEMRRFVDIINDSGSSLMNLLNDILDLSKLEAGKVKLENTPFRLSDILEKVAAVHALKAQDKDIEFNATIDDDVADNRIGDPHRLTQVLHNILSNAVKFTDAGSVSVIVSDGRIETGNHDSIMISVTDTGIGMTEEQVARIFEAFNQADSSTTRKYGGTGLGVSIVESIVKAMGGTICLESEPKAGSTFHITIPLGVTDSAITGKADSSVGEVKQIPDDARILVAEDNITNRLIMEAFLRNAGITVSFVEDGRQAVAACVRDRFDLILMDIHMPEMDGEQALKEIRTLEKTNRVQATPIIAVTADAMQHQVTYYLDLGFDGHLPKPIKQEALVQLIARMLGSPAGEGPQTKNQPRTSKPTRLKIAGG